MILAALVASSGTAASTAPGKPTAASYSLPALPICGSAKRITCVVDGDTIWIEGEKIRLEGFNSPEVNGRCEREKDLAKKATDELQAILSSEPISITRNGRDRYKRTLATISNSQGDIGALMIAKGVAHKWRGRKESWCHK